MNRIKSIFPTFGWVTSTSPFMIPRMYFKLKVSDIMGSSSQNVLSSLGDSLLGTITIDLNAQLRRFCHN